MSALCTRLCHCACLLFNANAKAVCIWVNNVSSARTQLAVLGSCYTVAEQGKQQRAVHAPMPFVLPTVAPSPTTAWLIPDTAPAHAHSMAGDLKALSTMISMGATAAGAAGAVKASGSNGCSNGSCGEAEEEDADEIPADGAAASAQVGLPRGTALVDTADVGWAWAAEATAGALGKERMNVSGRGNAVWGGSALGYCMQRHARVPSSVGTGSVPLAMERMTVRGCGWAGVAWSTVGKMVARKLKRPRAPFVWWMLTRLAMLVNSPLSPHACGAHGIVPAWLTCMQVGLRVLLKMLVRRLARERDGRDSTACACSIDSLRIAPACCYQTILLPCAHGGCPACLVRTGSLAQFHGHCRALQDIPAHKLHNGGNDARFTLEALLVMADALEVEQLKEERSSSDWWQQLLSSKRRTPAT